MSTNNGAGGSAADEDMAGPADFPSEDIAILRAESHEQLELLRTLVKLLLPKADDDGPKLEDLIAALVAQQRDILVCIRQMQSDLVVLLERSEGDRGNGQEPAQPNGSGNRNRSSPI
jgi:hypothetical protein